MRLAPRRTGGANLAGGPLSSTGPFGKAANETGPSASGERSPAEDSRGCDPWRAAGSGAGLAWIFFVNVPFAYSRLCWPRDCCPRVSAADELQSLRCGRRGSVTAGLVLLVYGLVNTNQYAWGSFRTIGELFGAAILLGLFVLIQADPQSNLSYRFGSFAIADIRLQYGGGSAGHAPIRRVLLLTLYMQQVLGFSPIQAGFAYVPFTIGIMITSIAGSVLVNRVGVKWLLAMGLLIVTVGI